MSLIASIRNFFGFKKKGKCRLHSDGKYYCFKQVQGNWEACSGPFDSEQECIQVTGENCK